jgi:hypothetical protein
MTIKEEDSEETTTIEVETLIEEVATKEEEQEDLIKDLQDMSFLTVYLNIHVSNKLL